MTARRALICLIACAALVRAAWIDIPFLEPFNNYSRQSMCASVARNYFAHGFRLLEPEIDENGTGPYLYNVELPLHSFIAALGYRWVGAPREWVPRSLSVAFSLLLLLACYRLFRRRGDGAAALGAVFFLAFSPMAVALSRSIQPDMAMLLAGTAAVWSLDRFLASGRKRSLVAAAALMIWAVLTRVYALYFLFVLAFLWTQKKGKRAWLHPGPYIFAAAVSSALIWYAAMWAAGQRAELAYEPYRQTPDPGTPWLAVKVFFMHLLTPLGSVLALAGLRRTSGARPLALAWLAATLVYLLLVWPTAVWHPYYLLPLAVPMSYFVGAGLAELWRGRRWLAVAAAALLVLNGAYYYRLLYFIPADRMAVVRAGAAVDRAAAPSDLVVASYHTSPIQLYYCHRKGWTLDLASGDDGPIMEKLESYRIAGARYFVTTHTDRIRRSDVLSKYLSGFERLPDDGTFVAWRLERRSP